jgi:hypothetical protein
MTNPKFKKLMKSLRKIPKNQLGEKDLLSPDLAKRIGNLADKVKTTIRPRESILLAAKKRQTRSSRCQPLF